MAAKKKSKKREAFVSVTGDGKTGRLEFTRRGDANDVQVVLCAEAIPDTDMGVHAVLKWDGSSTQECDGTWLTYSDVQWLAQAMPEILNEMERRGLDD